MAQPEPQPDPKRAEREARLQRILRAVEEQLRATLPDPDQPLEQIEQEVVEIGRTLREIIERETLEAAGSGYVGSQAPCACGRSARYVTMNRRGLVTLNGERSFRRAYYHCAACGEGFCPLDQRWQWGRGEQSVGVCALAARFVAYVSFSEGGRRIGVRDRDSPVGAERAAGWDGRGRGAGGGVGGARAALV